MSALVYVEFIRDPEPVGLQLDRLKQSEAKKGRELIAVEWASLHDPESRSYVVTSRAIVRDPLGPPKSDEVRIYDLINGELMERFRYRPPAPRPGLAYEFSILKSGDLDGDGAGEVVGIFRTVVDNGQGLLEQAGVEYPLAISWDPRHGEYRADPLLPDSFDEIDFGNVSSDTRRRRRAYSTPLLLSRSRSEAVRAYGAEELTLTTHNGEPLLLAGLIVEDVGTILEVVETTGGLRVRQDLTVFVSAMPLDFTTAETVVASCASVALNRLGPVFRAERVTPDGLLKAWRKFRPHADC